MAAIDVKQEIQQEEAFQLLDPQIRNYFKKELGHTQLTSVQKCTIEKMLSNFDCIVQSPKGSGKSLAFILPMMHILLKKKEKIGQSKEVSCKIIGLIIVPSRELVNQIFQLCKPICSTLEFRLIRLFGSSVLRNQELKVDVDQFKGNCVVITTPVSFDSFVNQHNQLKEYLKFLQVLIIDEADKFKDQFTRNSICSVLSILPEQRRSALFSATEMADKFEAKVNELARFGLRNPLKLTIGSDNIIQMNKEGEEDDQQEEEKKEIKQEDGSIVTPKPIDNDKVPDDIKTKRLAKFKLLPEIQLDILKCLDFSQLLTVQQSSFYFKNFIEKYGKELAKKEFFSLEFGSVFEELKLEDNECKFVKIELEHRFVEIEPHLYDFELSEQIKEKWEQGIEESVPMFFTMGDNEDIDMVVCELQQNRAEDDVYLQLPKFPKNMEEMKIARFLFQLLFNCAFESFYISTIVINPKMIELLFEETNMPLQIYSQKTSLTPYDNFSNFAWNHLSSNKLTLNTCTCAKDDEMDFFFKLLTERGNKFSNIRYTDVASRIYNSIIKHIETAQDVTKMVKEIKFEYMFGPLNLFVEIPSETGKNIKILEAGKTTKFQLSNKHNPKIKFSVTIKEPEEWRTKVEEIRGDRFFVAFNAVIKRIN